MEVEGVAARLDYSMGMVPTVTFGDAALKDPRVHREAERAVLALYSVIHEAAYDADHVAAESDFGGKGLSETVLTGLLWHQVATEICDDISMPVLRGEIREMWSRLDANLPWPQVVAEFAKRYYLTPSTAFGLLTYLAIDCMTLFVEEHSHSEFPLIYLSMQRYLKSNPPPNIRSFVVEIHFANQIILYRLAKPSDEFDVVVAR